MANKSPIKWTESTFEQNLKALLQFAGNNQLFGFNPFKNIFVFFRRIARCTSRNDILKCGIAPFDNWYNVVEGGSRCTAISASLVKLFQDLNLNFRFYRFAITLAAVCVLSSLTAVFFVCRISYSSIFGFVRLAQTAFNYKFRFQPSPTFTTPTQTFFSHQSTFTNTDIVRFWFVITRTAFTFQPIKARTVFSKTTYRFPLLTNCAFFQTCFSSFKILGNRNSGFLRRTFSCTVFSLSHITIILVYSILAREVGFFNGI